MLRKTLSAVAAVAAVAAMGVGTAGVANASTPIVKTADCTIPVVVGCTPDHDGHGHGFGHGFGHGLGGGFLGGGLGLGGLLGGNNTYIDNRFRNTFWQRDGVILPYAQAASACGCSGAPVGYTLVQDPQQVIVVPEGQVVTGDGSCSLTSVNWGLDGFRRGARFFRR